jgi:hypothetical protein
MRLRVKHGRWVVKGCFKVGPEGNVYVDCEPDKQESKRAMCVYSNSGNIGLANVLATPFGSV